MIFCLENNIVFETEDEKKIEQLKNGCKVVDGKIVETEEYLINFKENKIKDIQDSFNEKIQDYNSQYPIEEQKRFSDKSLKAKDVLDGLEDTYIDKKAISLGITSEQFASIIIQKAEEFEVFYTECEIERDTLISNL